MQFFNRTRRSTPSHHAAFARAASQRDFPKHFDHYRDNSSNPMAAV
jgi:hypothetical protein